MNRKQLICMWIGIVAVVWFAFWTVLRPYFWLDGYAKFGLYLFLVALVTGGLIYTFKDKKDKKPKDEQEQ